MYQSLVRPILFLLSPEMAHQAAFLFMRLAQNIPGAAGIIRQIWAIEDRRLERTVFGITFPNPVGLAAGMDKECEAFDMLGAMGFGFIEVGTIVPEPQPGNPKPRLFRLPKDKALINRMGFNSKGLAHAVRRLQKRKSKVVIGGNIGKNKVTPNDEAVRDYEQCFEALYPCVDFFVVNVSSPNTPNLRQLQDKEPLELLLSSLQKLNREKPRPKPVLLKIAPDLSFTQIDEVLEIVENTGIAGIVATNTTIGRENLSCTAEEIAKIGAGGLSGRPLARRSTEVIRYIVDKSQGRIPVIGVGGIMTAQDALEKLAAGASLVELYTGFVYAGPGLISEINRAILNQGER